MKFKIYSKYGCGYCTKIENVFRMLKLDYVVYKLNEDFTKQEFQNTFGENVGFPQIVLNDEQMLGGCIDTIKYIKENNLVN